MAATIDDVARLAGVGKGTVSRVLNERTNVDPATRARVLAAIAELEYVPSATARRLSLGRTQTIAVVVPHLATPSVVERIRGIEAALAEHGYDMIIFNVESVERRDAVLEDLGRRERVDGLILVSIEPRDEELRRLEHLGVGLVLVDASHEGVPGIVVDDVEGGALAARHVIDLGHRELAFVGDPPRLPLGSASSRLRLQGVRREVERAGLRLPAGRVATGEHGRTVAADLTRDLLRRRDRPTAILCASDTQAVGALEAAASLGLEVPHEVSIVGYDDIELAAYVGLTTVRQPLYDMGASAAAWLVGSLRAPSDGHFAQVAACVLVARRSTAPPPARPSHASS